MKILFSVLTFSALLLGCNNSSKSEADVKNDSTILLAPESNSNMTDLNGKFTDSSKVDSSHLNTDSLLAK